MLNHSFRLQTDYFLKLFEDLPRYKHCSQLYGFINHPLWLIGHLAGSYDQMNEILTGSRELNKKWDTMFGTGSKPTPISTMYPTDKLLINTFKDRRDDLLYSYSKLTIADLTRPNNVPHYQDHLPTLGDLLSHIMCGHTMYHIGQLTTYRTIHSLPRIPERFDTSSVDKESGSFECPICDAKFTKRNAFASHLRTVHPDGNETS